MPLCTLHLLALVPGTPLKSYVSSVKSSLPPMYQPLLAARPQRWVVLPEKLTTDALLNPFASPHVKVDPAHPPTTTAWDLVLLLPTGSTLPAHLFTSDKVRASFTLTVGIPAKVLDTFMRKNEALLRPSGPLPPLTQGHNAPIFAVDEQKLELSPEFKDWAQAWKAKKASPASRGAPGGAVSMLNLLAFTSEPGARERYAEYGKAFAESVGKKRGGDAKIVGKVTGGDVSVGGKAGLTKTGEAGSGGWEEVAVAHYPSIDHFMDMIGSSDYQAVNWEKRWRSLKDTCILMTSELDSDIVAGMGPGFTAYKL